VRQIRLRDLGGLIIIDFIDMEREEHRQQVYKALRRALVEDKARTNVLEISELGLVEMTRKRVRQDLRSLFATQCPTCKGSGTVKSDAALAAEIARKVHGVAAEGGGRDLLVRAHADLVRYFEAEGREGLEQLQSLVGRKVLIQVGGPGQSREEYDVVAR